MKISRRTRIWIIVAAVVLLAALVGMRFLLVAGHGAAGGYLVLSVLVVLLVWKLLRKDDSGEVAALKKQLRELDRRLAEKDASRLNVVELSPIMHVAVMKADTSFVRPYVREEGKSVFNGALRADLCVEYGVKLEEVRFRYDAGTNTLLMADFHPGIISFSKKQLSWEFAKTYRSVSLFGHELYEMSDKDSDMKTAQICEQLRAELEAEIDSRQVTEFAWLSPLVADQVMDVIRVMLGRSDMKIAIAEHADDNFVPLQQLRIANGPDPQLLSEE